MAFPALVPAEKMPIHVLFPEQYEASKRMIALDFLYLGGLIVALVVLAAMVNLAIA